jgi:hypothetical protein
MTLKDVQHIRMCCLHKNTHLCKGHTACVDLALYTQDDLEEWSAFPMETNPVP